MTADAGQNGRLDTATKRLGRAMALLEQRLARDVAEAGAQADGLFDQDRAKLAAQLDAARGRERALQEAGALASKALAGAIADLHAALGRETP
jgi:ABC-type phosphate transport system auxiliary subunit